MLCLLFVGVVLVGSSGFYWCDIKNNDEIAVAVFLCVCVCVADSGGCDVFVNLMLSSDRLLLLPLLVSYSFTAEKFLVHCLAKIFILHHQTLNRFYRIFTVYGNGLDFMCVSPFFSLSLSLFSPFGCCQSLETLLMR